MTARCFMALDHEHHPYHRGFAADWRDSRPGCYASETTRPACLWTGFGGVTPMLSDIQPPSVEMSPSLTANPAAFAFWSSTMTCE